MMENKYPVLWQFFAGHYHQDVWTDFDMDVDVWRDFNANLSHENRLRFIQEIDDLINEPKEFALTLMEHALDGGGTSFESYQSLRLFLEELLLFCRDNVKS